MNKNVAAAIIAVLVVGAVGAAAFALSKGNGTNDTAQNNNPGTQQQADRSQDSNNNAPATQAVQTDSVEIKEFAFTPQTIKVKAGTKVTWTNQDTVKHDVTVDGTEGPESELLAKGESYSYTFDKAGTYEYYCTPHPYMTGTVIVE